MIENHFTFLKTLCLLTILLASPSLHSSRAEAKTKAKTEVKAKEDTVIKKDLENNKISSLFDIKISDKPKANKKSNSKQNPNCKGANCPSKELISVSRTETEKDVVLISDFSSAEPEADFTAAEMRQALGKLLNKTKYIKSLNHKETLQNLFIEVDVKNFKEIKKSGVDFVLNGIVERNTFDKTVDITVILWDMFAQSKIMLKTYTIPEDLIETAKKVIVTDIYYAITGEFGFFYGSLMFLMKDDYSEFQKIAINDYRHNEVDLHTSGKNIIMSPKYCYRTNQVLFAMQEDDFAQLYITDLFNGSTNSYRKNKLNMGSIMNNSTLFSPDISKDCNKILFSMAKNGATNIYIFDIEENQITKLTNTKGIATSPKFFDNDSKVVYTSNRSGSSRVYTMNINGDEKTLVSGGYGQHMSPSVSGDGKSIAFIKIKSGVFSLMVCDIDGKHERRMLSSFLIENPIWTPIGENIIFSTRDAVYKKSKIYSISTITGEKRLFNTIGSATEPAWIDKY